MIRVCIAGQIDPSDVRYKSIEYCFRSGLFGFPRFAGPTKKQLWIATPSDGIHRELHGASRNVMSELWAGRPSNEQSKASRLIGSVKGMFYADLNRFYIVRHIADSGYAVT